MSVIDTADSISTVGFVVLPVAVILMVAIAIPIAFRRTGRPLGRGGWGLLAIGLSLWLALPAGLAQSGVLADVYRKPPLLVFLFAGMTVATSVVGSSRIGAVLARGIPLAWLVLSQAFRLPLELLMDHAATIGLMPPQMSLHGWNYDIVTGATAALLGAGLLVGRLARRWVLAWNVLGTLLLLNVVILAIISMPMIAAFGSDRVNTWVADWPFIWLPTVLVQCAVLGHIVIFRKLSLEEPAGHRT